MFDISWSEFLLIGVVALIVIGPKELPAVMRTLGQWTRKVRSMAGDFQNQFQEAMREAEMADLKKEVDDLAHDVRNFDPLKEVRDDAERAGADVQQSLTSSSDPAPPALPADAAATGLAEAPAETPPASFEAATPAAAPTPLAATPERPSEEPVREMESVGAGGQTCAAESVEKPAHDDGTGPAG
jgi:sec-independent protein translocase protein TatB